MLNFFTSNPKKTLIFIVEDDIEYSSALEQYLLQKFPEKTDVKSFPTGELCLLNLHLNPDFIILDDVLNSVYPNAQEGFDILQQIKIKHPDTTILLLSSQKNIHVAFRTMKEFESIYIYKDEAAFENIKNSIDESLS